MSYKHFTHLKYHRILNYGKFPNKWKYGNFEPPWLINALNELKFFEQNQMNKKCFGEMRI